MSDVLRRRLITVGKTLLTLLLLAAAMSIVTPAQVWAHLRQLPPSHIGSVAMAGLLGLAIQWVKWQRLLSHVRQGTTHGEGLRSLLAGFTAGLFSPGRLGELGRGLFLSGSRTATTAAAVTDRVCSVYVTLVAGALGLLCFQPVAGAFALGVVAVAGALVRHWLHKLPSADIGQGFLETRKWTGSVIQAIRKTRFAVHGIPTRLWTGTLLWSALFNLVFFAQFLLLLGPGSGHDLSAVAAIPIVFSLKALFPVGMLDLGAREAAAVLVFTSAGLDPTAALGAALAIYTLNVLIPGLAGLPFLIGSARGSLGDIFEVMSPQVPNPARLMTSSGEGTDR